MKFRALAFTLLVALAYSPAVFSQDEEEEAPTFTLSGSVDTYFHSTFGSYIDADGFEYHAPGTSFANMRGFGLGMVNLIASYSGEKVGITADLVFGPRGKDAVFGDLWTGQGIINQMFAYLKVSDGLTLNLGQFNTFIGYEVISPTINANYSTSYLFSYGPFNHTGLRADFNFGESGWVGKLAIMNPTDLVEFNPVNTYTYGGQLGFTNDNGGAWLNLLYGDQDGDGDGTEPATFQVDLTSGWNLSESIYLGLNASLRDVGDEGGFYGIAVYPKLTLSESFVLALRAEYFAVQDGYVAPFALDSDNNGNVIDFTVSGNKSIGNLTLIPEFRIDLTSEDTFENDGEVNSMMPSFNFAAVYKF